MMGTMIEIAVYLFILGLCLGSFVNALVWRIHVKKDWVKARSQCPNCAHQLAARDLVPVLSWLWLRGKCRYCKAPILGQYPLVEITGALVLSSSYLLWPYPLSEIDNLVLFVTWLVSSVGLLALLVYDIRWMILPNKIIYPTFFIAAAGQLIYVIGFEPHKFSYLLQWMLSVTIASGIFLVLFLISKGRWIGYGDVRLGLITGTLLHSPILALLMIFLASLLGSVAVLPMLLAGKKSLSEKLPYGPFLIAATFICLIFGDNLISYYKSLFLL